jgi:anthranilate/para-aminobenzoate synthase component I
LQKRGFALEPSLPSDWFWRLAELPGAFWLRDGDVAYAGALPVAVSRELDPEPDLLLPAFPASPDRNFPRWVGLLPYEAFRGLESEPLGLDVRPAPRFESILWHRYRAVVRIRGAHVELVGESRAAEVELSRALADPPRPRREPKLTPLGDPESDATHETRIRRALENIAHGDLYQVNLARRLQFAVEGSALELLAALGESPARAPWVELGGARCAFALDLGDAAVVSLSPEHFLRTLPGPQVHTTPIKGTRPRSSDAVEDSAWAKELLQSDKEHAELTMVIDLERNDLGKVCVPGSVILLDPPKIVSHDTVHHREATVAGILRTGVSRTQLLSAMMPSGSVTGAPKRAAMDLIRALEPERRGLYTGAHGYIAQDGTLALSMAIRCLTVDAGVGHYWVGGGIVADSQPQAEVEETRWKAQQLSRLVQDRFC